mgnify:CR=1 FL=1
MSKYKITLTMQISLTLMPKAIVNIRISVKYFFILKIVTYPTTAISFLVVREFF